MDYRITDDGELLRDSLRRQLSQRPTALESHGGRGPNAAGKGLVGSGWVDAYAGVFNFGDPPAMLEALHIIQAFGEFPVPGPTAIVAGFVAPLLGRLGGGAKPLYDQVCGGRLVSAVLPLLAGVGISARWSDTGREVTLREAPGGMVADGTAEWVLGTDAADAVLVPARLGDRPVLAALPLAGPGVQLATDRSVDLRQGAARVTWAATPVTEAEIIEVPDRAAHSHAAAVALCLFLDAEAVGGMAEVTARTVAYVRERRQFGRPVGSFQAVRHRIADMATALETARSLSDRAAWDTAAARPGALLDVLASRLHASAAYVAVCEAAIQCHGGIGFTWEQGLHVWYRAALLGRGLLTDVPAIERALGGHLAKLVAEHRGHGPGAVRSAFGGVGQ